MTESVQLRIHVASWSAID